MTIISELIIVIQVLQIMLLDNYLNNRLPIIMLLAPCGRQIIPSIMSILSKYR